MNEVDHDGDGNQTEELIKSSSRYAPYESHESIPLHPKYQESIRKSMKEQQHEVANSLNVPQSVIVSFLTTSDRDTYYDTKRLIKK